jgi:hypothetical protein
MLITYVIFAANIMSIYASVVFVAQLIPSNNDGFLNQQPSAGVPLESMATILKTPFQTEILMTKIISCAYIDKEKGNIIK